jgi:hypothetical protein
MPKSEHALIKSSNPSFVLQNEHAIRSQEMFQKIIKLPYESRLLSELEAIRREIKRPIVPIQNYAKTKHAANYLDVDPSFLDKKRRAGLLKAGMHYYQPPGSRLILWDLNALDAWVRSEGINNDTAAIIDSMFK